MTLEKITNLHSIEILTTSGVNVRWDTSITESGVVISGPNIHRRAFSAEELADIQPEINALIAKFGELNIG